jgi:hypothetical protein
VPLLFVAAAPLTRVELSLQLKIGQTRLARACELAKPTLAQLGLVLIEDGQELVPGEQRQCSTVVERFLAHVLRRDQSARRPRFHEFRLTLRFLRAMADEHRSTARARHQLKSRS